MKYNGHRCTMYDTPGPAMHNSSDLPTFQDCLNLSIGSGARKRARESVESKFSSTLPAQPPPSTPPPPPTLSTPPATCGGHKSMLPLFLREEPPGLWKVAVEGVPSIGTSVKTKPEFWAALERPSSKPASSPRSNLSSSPWSSSHSAREWRPLPNGGSP